MSQQSSIEADEVTGLTRADVTLIRDTWAELIKTPAESGVILLGLLLERFPEHIPLFPFRDVPKSELQTNELFVNHSESTANALNDIVNIIDDSTLLIPHLVHVGYTHLVKKVTRASFLHFKTVIIDVFSTLFEPEELEAWRKALDVIFIGILSGLSAADQFSDP